MEKSGGVNLADIPIFKGLPDEDIAALEPLAERLEIARGEGLFRQGDPADCFYVVLSGGLDIVVRSPGGGTHVVAHMAPGAVVGETSLLIGGERSASALATDATTLLSFPDEQLRKLLRSDSLPAYRVVYRLAEALAHRLREIDAHIAQLSWDDADASAAEDDLDRLRRIFFADWGQRPRGDASEGPSRSSL
jgi:CRP-like cAMP-binding protein